MARQSAQQLVQRGGPHGQAVKRPGIPRHLGGTGRRHRMNVANVKALKRATRRLLGFYHLSHQVMKSLGVLAHKKHVRPTVHTLPSHRGQRLLPPGRGDFYMGGQ
jgi:hypothetical protein